MFFEREKGGEAAVLVHLDFNNDNEHENAEEFLTLVQSANLEVADFIKGKANSINSHFFMGTGKADEIYNSVVATNANVVIINHTLSPTQERNLEAHIKCRVIDRTGLILDIFAKRAKTFEGKLQVELAQLQHISTRLVRGWQHLERQKGGIGLRGPGEKQLETDRRLLRNRVSTLKKRLDKIKKQREVSRNYRKKSLIQQVSLVGYTNAGKSTVFNLLTGDQVLAEDRLFATLDPTIRKIDLPNIGRLTIADTVGFIRHLPHALIDSFKATLEEVCQADLLLHIIDYSNEDFHSCVEQVHLVLQEIGADHIQVLEVLNKIDVKADSTPKIKRNEMGVPVQVSISATEHNGIQLLEQCISECLTKNSWFGNITLNPSQGKVRALLHEKKSIIKEQLDNIGNITITVKMPKVDFEILKANENLTEDSYERF